MDLVARMPVKVEPSATRTPLRLPVVKTNAMVGRQNRFREQAGAITWSKSTARNVHDFLWALLPQHYRDNNLALPRDLTQQERWQLRALNVGKRPENSRKVPNADKGMTREQYIEGVRNKAAGTRAVNPRRIRKEAVRNAAREATVAAPAALAFTLGCVAPRVLPATRGPINPPLPFVRHGEYLSNDHSI